jgi:uncharacterized protein
MKRAFIIHGWEASPDSNWFPWLKKELENKGFSVEVLNMPDTDHPEMGKWLAHLKKTIINPDENTYLIGHSLGVITILRYLEQLENQKIGGAVIVAGFPESIGFDEISSFFKTPLNYEKVKNAARHFMAIHSDNDPYVPIKNGEILRDKLGAKLFIMKNAGHLNEGNGKFELPIALTEILKMSSG